MEVIESTCVNSKWVARFLAEANEDHCECPGCKVRCKDDRGYEYVLSEGELRLLRLESASAALLAALRECVIDLRACQRSAASAAKQDSRWEGVADVLAPSVDASEKAIDQAVRLMYGARRPS